MLTLFTLLSTIGSGSVVAELPEARLLGSESAPIRLWMNNDRRYRQGDRVRLQVDADADGYLLVLNYDTEGRVKVLFPLDPRDDSRVQAGRRYEVRDGSSQEAFRAYGDGTGLIFTAISRDPWRFEDVVLADRWDYTRIEIDPSSRDPEADLSSLVQSIAGPSGFDYDVIGYRVYGETSYSSDYNSYTNIYLHDTYNNCYYSSFFYNSCRGWPYGGWAYGFGYSRYNYGFGYSPYGYGYGYGGYYPYYPYRSGRDNRGPILVGRPRSYTVQPRPVIGNRFSGALPRGLNSERNVSPPTIDWRSRARPASGITSRGPESVSRDGGFDRGPQAGPRGGGFDRGSEAAPPARRSRPEGVSYPAARGGERGGNDRGGDRGISDRGRREAPPAARGGNDGARSAPPARSEPSHRSAPPARAEPSRGNGGGGGGGHSSPPPSRPRRP